MQVKPAVRSGQYSRLPYSLIAGGTARREATKVLVAKMRQLLHYSSPLAQFATSVPSNAKPGQGMEHFLQPP